jgi:hypothetical protein
VFTSAIDAHPNPVRQIDLDHPDTLGQGEAGTPRHAGPAAIGTVEFSPDASPKTPS